MKRQLNDHVERILDTQSHKRAHDVIVQMEPSPDERRAISRASTEALLRRYSTISPRELAPPHAKLLTQDISNRHRKRLLASRSMTSRVALNVIPSRELAALKTERLSALTPLRENEFVKKQPRRTARPRAGRPADTRDDGSERFRTSWSSRSVLLTLSRDDLKRFADTVPDIDGIYANGIVSVPPVVEVQDVSKTLVSTVASSWGVEKIGALAVWGAYGVKGTPVGTAETEPPVKVAVLDTGVDATHPELKNKIINWAEFDAKGDRVRSVPHDSGSHGTHVCGTIAGGSVRTPSSATPIVGVAPAAQLMVGLVLNKSRGTHAQILAGIDWAIENGAEIINMSLGGVHLQPDVVDLYTQSIVSANLNGIPVVAAIGNEGAQITGLPGSDYFAFSVGATDHIDRAAGFSGGRTHVIHSSRYIRSDDLPLYYSKPEVTAPGVAIRSCTPRGAYETWNGTSMAAPHVSGALALVLAATGIRNIPSARRAYLLQDLLMSNVEELGEAGRDHRFGFGRINILRAVAMAIDLGYGDVR